MSGSGLGDAGLAREPVVGFAADFAHAILRQREGLDIGGLLAPALEQDGGAGDAIGGGAHVVEGLVEGGGRCRRS